MNERICCFLPWGVKKQKITNLIVGFLWESTYGFIWPLSLDNVGLKIQPIWFLAKYLRQTPGGFPAGFGMLHRIYFGKVLFEYGFWLISKGNNDSKFLDKIRKLRSQWLRTSSEKGKALIEGYAWFFPTPRLKTIFSSSNKSAPKLYQNK